MVNVYKAGKLKILYLLWRRYSMAAKEKRREAGPETREVGPDNTWDSRYHLEMIFARGHSVGLAHLINTLRGRWQQSDFTEATYGGQGGGPGPAPRQGNTGTKENSQSNVGGGTVPPPFQEKQWGWKTTLFIKGLVDAIGIGSVYDLAMNPATYNSLTDLLKPVGESLPISWMAGKVAEKLGGKEEHTVFYARASGFISTMMMYGRELANTAYPGSLTNVLTTIGVGIGDALLIYANVKYNRS